MDSLFLQVLNMSITASYVIVFVIMARLLLKKVPKIFSYALWFVVLFRLVCPFSFESVFSLLPAAAETIPQDIMYSQTPQIHSGIPIIDQGINRVMPSPVVGASVNPMQIWIALGELVWLAGMAVLFLYSVFTTVKLYRKLRSATSLSGNIYELNDIKTPFVFGIKKPNIYLPVGLSEYEKAYIIKHEQIHIKRFDHIVKLFAFLVVCIHWFNPLVWIAFYLMTQDMELSCDESVIKEMGSDIKKDYSTSLLSLSTGRKMIGGCPITFSQNNTKGRIMNILNYKKPAFWAVLLAIMAVLITGIGLMSNPKVKQLTVEDYAEQFIKDKIAVYGELEWSQDFKIVDSKITNLEKVAHSSSLDSSPVEGWQIEYRLKPDDISKVMFVGGMNEEDGWITEDSSGGKPILVFSYEDSKPKYLGYTWSGDADFSTLAGQETALRIFLEGMDLLPHETYPGNHILVKFPLSSGDTSQLFLSQPVVQGNRGIWCVERWKDTNGNEYHSTPQTDLIPIEYYRDLQKQVDEGHRPGLLDPVQVAFHYIHDDIGQRVSMEELKIKSPATVEDFAIVPESYFIGYISGFTVDNSSFHLDPVEFLTEKDRDRIKELKIEPADMPSGYYIYNPETYPTYCAVTDETEYYILNVGGTSSHKLVSKEECIEYFNQWPEYVPLCEIITRGGYVISMREVLVP